MAINKELHEALGAITAQARAFRRRAESLIEKQYSDTMEKAAGIFARFALSASFEQLIQAERAFQKNDLLVYAQRPETLESVQEGIGDFEDGEMVYKQLLENTEAYISHRYRKKDRLLPENILPLDTMRKALRGQIKRVENYRTNVMGNIREQEFLSARIAMLRRAEKLYDEAQRERLGLSNLSESL